MAIVIEPLTCRVAPLEPTLLGLVQLRARISNRPVRPLHLQALLQMPRVADSCGLVALQVAHRLLSELAEELPVNEDWKVSGDLTSPLSLKFHGVSAAIARDITERFHYLRSPRFDGRSYGLFTSTGSLVAICVSSPVDVPHLGHLLSSSGCSSKLARVISRVFVFEGAPRNSISHLLSRTAREERRLGITEFVTYVNPNMGFTGVSYRASGWQLLGEEPGTTYRYLDSRYVSDRMLESRFGEHDDVTYRQMLGDRFAVSSMPLAALMVFHKRLSG